MSASLIYKLYSIPLSEDKSPAIEVPLIARSDGAWVVRDQEELNFDETHRYGIYLVYSKSNNSLSLELSNAGGILIRFGGIVTSGIGLGTSIPSIGKHVEIIFDPG